jgi:hypothetical protein
MNLVNAVVAKLTVRGFGRKKFRDYLVSSPDRLESVTSIRRRVGREYCGLAEQLNKPVVRIGVHALARGQRVRKDGGECSPDSRCQTANHLSSPGLHRAIQ